MTRIYAKHPPYTDGHLGEVALDMDHAGEPTIRAVEFRGELFALEGSHRLYLSYERGLIPRIIVLEPDVTGCEAFFEAIRYTLPPYDFPHVLALRERDFT